MGKDICRAGILKCLLIQFGSGMKKHTTSINEHARALLEITRDEYAYCSYVQYRSSDPRGKSPGWCSDSGDEIAYFVGISRQGLHKMTARLTAKNLIEISGKGGKRVTGMWIDTENECKQSLHKTVNKVDKICKQSLHKTVNKVDEVYKELDIKLDEIEIEGEKEKTLPPATFDEMMIEVERLAVEAKKEKSPSIAGGFPKEEIDRLIGVNRAIRNQPTHTVKTVDANTIPGTLIRTVEGVNLEPTNGTEITIKTGMNEAGETYVFEHTERVNIPTGPRLPLASNAMEAQKIIETWCKDHGEQIRWAYDAARRNLTPEDLRERLIDFVGHYATTAEKQYLFFHDPARMFQNGLTKWLQRQNQFDREKRETVFAVSETKTNLPKSIRRY